jgi:hypothetical protein
MSSQVHFVLKFALCVSLAVARLTAVADDANPSTSPKTADVQWPGCISVFHGFNWGTDENYVTAIKEAQFGAAGATEAQIPMCGSAGLKAFVFAWPHESFAIAPKYKDDSTVLAFYMGDRYVPGQWGEFAEMERNMLRGNPLKPAIFTIYALRHKDQLDNYVPAVRPRAIEFYHHHWDPHRAPDRRYMILDEFRREAIQAGGVPVIEMVLVIPDDVRKTRQTVYGSLAYGTRGIRWWGGAQFFDLSKRDGRGVPQRTALGEDALRINTAIKAFDPVFAKTRCVHVFHAPPLPKGGQGTSAETWFQLGGEEVMAGVFEGPDKPTYLMLANRDAFQAHDALLSFKDAVEVQQLDKTTAQWRPLAGELDKQTLTVKVPLEEGGGEMISVVRKEAAEIGANLPLSPAQADTSAK